MVPYLLRLAPLHMGPPSASVQTSVVFVWWCYVDKSCLPFLRNNWGWLPLNNATIVVYLHFRDTYVLSWCMIPLVTVCLSQEINHWRHLRCIYFKLLNTSGMFPQPLSEFQGKDKGSQVRSANRPTSEGMLFSERQFCWLNCKTYHHLGCI